MSEIQAKLKVIREKQNLSASELAKRIGVSRQTIYAIEDGSFVPNTAIALRLARELEVRVDDLFSLPEETQGEVRAKLLTGSELKPNVGQLVRLSSVSNRLIAVPVPAFSNYLPEADGLIESNESTVRVKCAGPVPESDKALVLAGCDPALSFLENLLAPSGFRIITVPSASQKALEWLKKGRIHVAGSHLAAAANAEYNIPAVKRLFPRGGVRVVAFATWEQGIVTASGNPKNIRSIADLGNKRITIVNREKGSGSRALLDSGLTKAGIAGRSVAGYEREAPGHLPAAYAVASGSADCCIATRAAARSFGLHFVPLSEERFDLVLTKITLESPPGMALLDLLNRSKLRRKLQLLAGYDVSRTGSMLM